MVKKKLIRLAELEKFPNVFQMDKSLKGKWKESVFKNSQTITLELACGKGDYSVALARKHPERNFIGIDIKGARLWRGAKTALEGNLSNVVFLRTYIDHIVDYFAEEEVDEIWITFPDPYRERSKARKRLTSDVFLKRYHHFLKKGGIIHLKTDDLQLYEFTLDTLLKLNAKILSQTNDLYAITPVDEILAIKTFYEHQHLAEGKTIKYLKFHL